ncbi:MAG: damage-control phosphatase ARMT1 family protein [Desulfomonilaceae bacterium]
MKITPDCIVCNLKAGLMAIRELTTEESLMRELTAEIMQLPAMRALDWSMTGSQLVEQIFKRITAASGNSDPFRRWKEQQNEKCLQLYPRLKGLVTESEDPLFTAVNIAINGNSIDPMGHQNPDDVDRAIRESLANPVPRDRFNDLKDRLEQSSLVIYLGDNCGEIVFDKLLIETIKGHYDIEIVFVVRSIPTLNDATLREAKLIGMDDTAIVMENGVDGPLPGTILSRCSEQLQRLWSSADLVISKGGGNFDSLDEEESVTVPLYYMLMCKCIPYQDYFNIPLNYPILSRASSAEEGGRTSGAAP